MPRLPFGRQSPPRVYATRRLPGNALDRLRAEAKVGVWDQDGPPPYERLTEEVRDVEGLLCLLTDRIDAPLLEAAPKLRVVSTMAVGYDNIDVAAASARGIAVGHTPGVLTETTADFAFALLLAAARRVAEGDRAVREGRWPAWDPSFLLGRDVYGATLGIVGLGATGQAVARRARGFDMRVLYHSRTRRPEAEETLGCVFTGLEELLAESDFVSVHVPLSPETHHLFDDQAFGRMKPTAVFVNTSRGAIVDEAALLRALESRRIAGAGIDVAEQEPLAKHDPLLRLPTLVVTPHIASASVHTRERMAEMAVENLLAGLAGRLLPHCANAEALAE